MVTTVALLLVVLFLMNADIHFHDVIARFGALTTPPYVDDGLLLFCRFGRTSGPFRLYLPVSPCGTASGDCVYALRFQRRGQGEI